MAQPPPAPSAAGSLARDLGLAALVLLVAASHRMGWSDLIISIDWNRTVQAAADLVTGAPDPTAPLFLYTSMPALLLAGVLQLGTDPLLTFRLWALLGSLGAPLLFLGLRPVGGRATALLAALVLALSQADAHSAIGLRSPYAVSTFLALACWGLVGSARRRPWGPGLLAAGAAMAATLDPGLAPMTLAALAVALLATSRLRGRQARGAWLLMLLPCAVVGCVAVLDGAEILRNLRAMAGGFPPMPFMQPSPTWAVRFGLDLPGPILAVTLVWGAAGIAAVTLERLGARSPPSLESSTSSRLAIGGLLLLLAGAAPWVWAWRSHAYLWHHHLVGLQPLILATLVSLGVPLARSVKSHRLGAASWSPLLVWVIWSAAVLPSTATQRAALRAIPQRSVRFADQVAAAAADLAAGRSAQPDLTLLSPTEGFEDRCVFAQFTQDLARVLAPSALPHSVALAPPGLAESLGMGEPARDLPGSGLALWSHDDHEALIRASRGFCPDARQGRCWTCLQRASR